MYSWNYSIAVHFSNKIKKISIRIKNKNNKTERKTERKQKERIKRKTKRKNKKKRKSKRWKRKTFLNLD